MQTDRRGVIAAVLLVLLVGVAAPSSTAPDLDYPQLEVFEVLGASEQGNTTDWHTYRNDEHGFMIKYPPNFDLAKEANTLVAAGAVTTFIPAYDPSIDGTGAKTNLMEFSVTVGVTDSPVALPQRSAFHLAYAPAELGEPRGVELTSFTKSYSSEGAAGNRYEKLSYVKLCGDKYYEVALLLHSANPGCYSPGTITLFDSAEITRLFQTMVSTLLLGHKSL
ncbi:hypothetical protein ACFLSG_03660 [Candidatus Bipolaricaulota bacterium]